MCISLSTSRETIEINDCIEYSTGFIEKYNRLKCSKYYDYVLNLKEFERECKGGSEDRRLAYSKLEMVGEQVFTSFYPCVSSRNKDTSRTGDRSNL